MHLFTDCTDLRQRQCNRDFIWALYMVFCVKLTNAHAVSFQEVSPNCHKVPRLFIASNLSYFCKTQILSLYLYSCFPVEQPNVQHLSPVCSLCHHGIPETWASRKCKEKPNFSHKNHCSSRAKQQMPKSQKLLTDRQLSYPQVRSISPLPAAQ